MIPINILNKTKTKSILKYLGNNANEKLENIQILLDEMNSMGYQAGTSLTKYDEYISVSVYFKSINVFILSIWEDFLRIDLARRNESGTIPMKRIPIVEKIIKKTIFSEKQNHVEYSYSILETEYGIIKLIETLHNTASEIDEKLDVEYRKLSKKCSFLLNELTISNYKLYKKASIQLSPDVNLFIGDNGNGKTALLDAIYHIISAFQFMFVESKNYNKNKINADEDIHFEIYDGESGLPNIKKEMETQIIGDIFINEKNYELIRGKRLGGGVVGAGVNKDLEQYIEQVEIANKYYKTPILPVFSFYTTNRLLSKAVNLQKLEKNRFEIYNDTVRSRNNISVVTQFIKDCFIEQEKYHNKILAFTLIKSALEKAYRGLLEIEPKEKTVELKYFFNKIVLQIGEKYITLDQMSDGYQAVLGIVADIAYRIVILNPNTEDALRITPGVVLIDEIDLHLHPKWQKKFLKILKEIFPKIQIIATTHSPFVIQSLISNKDKLFILKDNEIEESEIADYYGLEDAVYSYMGVNNPRWSKYKMEEFISYKGFMDLYDEYMDDNGENKKNLFEKMRISLKQNETNIDVYSRMKKNFDIIELLEKERTNETS